MSGYKYHKLKNAWSKTLGCINLTFRMLKHTSSDVTVICLFVMFVTAACFLFLLKLKWPKNKNI